MSERVFSLLNAIDAWLAVLLSPLGRVVMLGLACGSVAIALYSATSNQKAIASNKQEARDLRRRLLDPDLDPTDFGRLTRRNLAVSFRLVGKVLIPSLISCLPVLLVALWLDFFQTYALPSGDTPVRVEFRPQFKEIVSEPEASFVRTDEGLWVRPEQTTHAISFSFDGHVFYSGTPGNPPTASIAKRSWWNSLVESPAGYIGDEAPIDEISIGYPAKRLIDGTPEWLGMWEFPFFASIFASALIGKVAFKVE